MRIPKTPTASWSDADGSMMTGGKLNALGQLQAVVGLGGVFVPQIAAGGMSPGDADAGLVVLAVEGLKERKATMNRDMSRPVSPPAVPGAILAGTRTLRRRNSPYQHGRTSYNLGSRRSLQMSLKQLTSAGTKVWSDSVEPRV